MGPGYGRSQGLRQVDEVFRIEALQVVVFPCERSPLYISYSAFAVVVLSGGLTYKPEDSRNILHCNFP
jgi:hypothetical protein